MAPDFTLQEVSRPEAAGSERILLDILEHDWREAQDSRQELCQKLHAVQGELQWAEELRDKVGTTARLSPPPCSPTVCSCPALGVGYWQALAVYAAISVLRSHPALWSLGRL